MYFRRRAIKIYSASWCWFLKFFEVVLLHVIMFIKLLTILLMNLYRCCLFKTKLLTSMTLDILTQDIMIKEVLRNDDKWSEKYNFSPLVTLQRLHPTKFTDLFIHRLHLERKMFLKAVVICYVFSTFSFFCVCSPFFSLRVF